MNLATFGIFTNPRGSQQLDTFSNSKRLLNSTQSVSKEENEKDSVDDSEDSDRDFLKPKDVKTLYSLKCEEIHLPFN